MCADKFVVEISVGVCRTVSGDQQSGAVEIGCVYGCKLDLYGPLGKLTFDHGSIALANSVPIDGFGIGSGTSARQGCNEFTIPFNRQQLADYLSVDRSAMSNELCKMRNEGILYFDKNRFILKQANGKEQ